MGGGAGGGDVVLGPTIRGAPRARLPPFPLASGSPLSGSADLALPAADTAG